MYFFLFGMYSINNLVNKKYGSFTWTYAQIQSAEQIQGFLILVAVTQLRFLNIYA